MTDFERREHLMKLLKACSTIFLSLGLLSGGSLIAASPSVAAMPPANYPMNDVFGHGSSPYGSIAIRRGFYDSDSNSGWAYDKARWKHGIWNVETMKFVLGSNYSGNTYSNGTAVQYAWAQEWQTVNGTRKLVREQKIRAVSILNRSVTVSGRTSTNPAGLFTMYCDFGDPSKVLCPSWVNNVTSRQAAASALSADVPSDSPTSGSSAPSVSGRSSSATADSSETSTVTISYKPAGATATK